MKDLAVCEEIINDALSGCFTVRYHTDTNTRRFKVHGYFDEYNEAEEFAQQLRKQFKGESPFA